jgi:polysaccharide biosynthesis/export protein
MSARSPRTALHALRSVAGFVVLLLIAAACARERPFLWVDKLRPQPEEAEYRAAVGDVLSVRVWNQESMSTGRTRVRDDGRISVPFLRDVEVAGMTTGEISSRLAESLKTYVVNPVVTVSLEERPPVRSTCSPGSRHGR